MGDKSKISWTNATWNPIIGCSPVSPACDNCYAEIFADNLANVKKVDRYKGVTKNSKWIGVTKFIKETMDQPIRWKKS